MYDTKCLLNRPEWYDLEGKSIGVGKARLVP